MYAIIQTEWIVGTKQTKTYANFSHNSELFTVWYYLQFPVLLQNLEIGDHFFEPIGDLDFVCPVIIRQAIP